MAEIRPFRGILYNQARVQIQDVVAPPYDVISTEQQGELYDRSPYNVVRLILGMEEDRYASAAKHFLAWQTRSILVRDTTAAFYALYQTFEDESGRTTTRKGFVALCKLEEFEKRIVLPHERTLARPREDRFKLLKATHANFSQVFSLYSDPEKQIDRIVNEVATSPPAVDVMFEGIESRLWRLPDENSIQVIQRLMSDKQVLIADGHHRYETALAYRDLMRSQSPDYSGQEMFNYVMMFFTNLEDEGLVIYPTHRLVHSLKSFDAPKFLARMSEYFVSREFKEPRSLLAALHSSSSRSFGVLIAGDPMFYLLSLKPTLSARDVVKDAVPAEVGELDVTLLHTLVLRDILGISTRAQEEKLNLDYMKSVDDTLQAVWNGHAQLAFLMNATKIEEVRNVAKAGHTMPQKSTFFFPKLLSGLVINSLTD